MSVITSFSQSALSLFLAVYIGLFLNVSVYYRRFDDVASPSGSALAKYLSALIELSLSVMLTFFLMRLISLGGRYFYRLIASLN
ncbi:hypothetical protein [Symbiopectobacterium purcellii]|uniref:hypothetical protein n=1 Tax=Symbiopectobacterium purcellii TaxID=2871826 RepID=UPI003F840512